MFTLQQTAFYSALLIAQLSITSCASLHDARDNNSPDKLAYRNHAPVVVTPHAFEPTPNDKYIANWAKQRADYLRSLDYQTIEQQNNSHQEYLLKTNLIESRYQLENSEIALDDDHDTHTALADLRSALEHYQRAARLANYKERIYMDIPGHKLQSLTKRTGMQSQCSCDSTNPHSYHTIEASIEHLLVEL